MESMLCNIISKQFSHHLLYICINTNFILLDSSSSTSITQMDTTSDMTVKSSSSSTSITQMDTTSDMSVKSKKTGDTTSGKQMKLTEKSCKKYMYGKIFILTYEKKFIDM